MADVGSALFRHRLGVLFVAAAAGVGVNGHHNALGTILRRGGRNHIGVGNGS